MMANNPELAFMHPDKHVSTSFTDSVMDRIKKDINRRIFTNLGASLFVSGVLIFFMMYTGFDFIYYAKNIISSTTGIFVKIEISGVSSMNYINDYVNWR